MVEISRVTRVAGVVAAGGLFDGPVREEWAERFLALPGHHLLVAREPATGTPVGMITGIGMSHPDKGTEMCLYELGVEEDHRRRGHRPSPGRGPGGTRPGAGLLRDVGARGQRQRRGPGHLPRRGRCHRGPGDRPGLGVRRAIAPPLAVPAIATVVRRCPPFPLPFPRLPAWRQPVPGSRYLPSGRRSARPSPTSPLRARIRCSGSCHTRSRTERGTGATASRSTASSLPRT